MSSGIEFVCRPSESGSAIEYICELVNSTKGFWSVSDISSLLLVLIAAIGVGIAWQQLRNIVAQQTAETLTQEASFLLSLDQMYEGAHLEKSRLHLVELRKMVEAEVNAGESTEYPYHPEVATSFSEKLSAMIKENPKEYVEVMKLAGFFETCGHMSYKHNIENSVLSLYDAAIARTYYLLMDHVDTRRANDPNPRYMENFEFIARLAAAKLAESHSVYKKFAEDLERRAQNAKKVR